MIKLRRDFLTKFILFSIIIGRCATAKEIGGLTIENKIQKGNLPDKYFVEQSSKEMIREKIDEEVIRAFDCTEESMASAEISLNPPSECKLEDGSAYHRPIGKKAQILERLRQIPRRNHLLHDPMAGQCRMVWRGVRNRVVHAPGYRNIARHHHPQQGPVQPGRSGWDDRDYDSRLWQHNTTYRSEAEVRRRSR